MLPTHTIDSTLRMVTFEVTQRLPTLDELNNILDELAADPEFHRGFGVMVNVGEFSVEPAYLRSALLKISARLSFFGASRWAFLTSNQDRYLWRADTEAFARRHGLMHRVFMDRAEAMGWLLASGTDAQATSPGTDSASH
jgi:hypothetical protein